MSMTSASSSRDERPSGKRLSSASDVVCTASCTRSMSNFVGTARRGRIAFEPSSRMTSSTASAPYDSSTTRLQPTPPPPLSGCAPPVALPGMARPPPASQEERLLVAHGDATRDASKYRAGPTAAGDTGSFVSQATLPSRRSTLEPLVSFMPP